jgi:hypothetical protein
VRYVKIPIRWHCDKEEINGTPKQQQECFDRRERDILENIRDGNLISWAFSSTDLENVRIEKEP